MHNSFVFGPTNPVTTSLVMSTFSGKRTDKLWESLVQVGGLCSAVAAFVRAMWETTWSFTSRTSQTYTAFPTMYRPKITLLTAWLYPQSTGPIKKTTKYIKEN